MIVIWYQDPLQNAVFPKLITFSWRNRLCQGENGDLGLNWHQSYGKENSTKVLGVSVCLAIDSKIRNTRSEVS